MKKVYLFISLMLSALAIGCNNSGPEEQTPVTPGVGGKAVITVNTTLPADLTWQAGDKVAINGLESEAVTEENAGGVSYPFAISGVEAPLVVVAPFEILSGLNEVTLPSVQDYVADSFDRSAYGLAGIAPEVRSVADGDDKNLVANVALNAVMGVVSLPLTLDSATAAAPIKIKQISLTALSGAPLSGVWNAEAETTTDEAGVVSYDVKLTADAAKSAATVNINCGEGVEINTSSPVYFNVVVPAGVYTGGFEAVVTDVDDHNYIITLAEDVAVERGAKLELASSVFTVVEKAPATLTVKIADAGVVWQEGDAVICNNELSSNTVAATEVGTQSAVFNFNAVAYPYSVFYPAEFYTTSGSLRFYDEQKLVKNGVDRNNLILVGYSNTTEVEMKSVCGIVSIPVTNNYEGETITLEKVEVTTSEGDPISGKYHINYRTGAITPVAGKPSVTLVASEDAPFSIEAGTSATISFAVPQGAIRSGLVLNIYSSVGVVENYKIFPTGVTVRGGEEVVGDAYTYQEVKIDAIRTAAELLDFAKCVNIGRFKKFVNEEGKVLLGGDIDMSEVSPENWVPIQGVLDEAGMPTGFDGIFDGQGFAIKNWTTSKPLFHTIAPTATVSNIVLDASCALNMPQDCLDGLTGLPSFGFVVTHNLGLVSGCVNNADVFCSSPDSAAVSRSCIVGYTAIWANVRDCINYGNFNIEIGNHVSGTTYIGCVNGRCASAAEAVGNGLFGCKNYGNLTINIIDSNTSKNFYIGGVTGSSNSYTVTSGCENYGNVTFNTPNSAALVCLAGVTPYSAGNISDCINEGNVTFNSTGQIKGTAVAGIAAYENGTITNCINKGAIYMTGKMFGGRNTLGSISTSAATSSAAPTVAGIVGYGYSSSGSPFAMENCHNYGKISYIWSEADGSGTSGRTQVAGVIGSPWGDVKNCTNSGDIECNFTYSAATANHLSYIGGIAGSDYYSKSQGESSIIDCTNTGNITVHSDIGTSNSTIGGIIGWPGKEGSTTNVTQGCVNKGNIVVSGESKMRVGGIQGGSGAMVDCVNEGMITINSLNAASAIGGLGGFHSNGYLVQNSTNKGAVVVNCKITGGVGGMIGNLGNSKHTEGAICGNIVNCLVKAAAGSTAGMLVGHFNGTSNAIPLGTEEEPLKVAGTFELGGAVTVISAESLADELLLWGNGGNYSSESHPAIVELYTE